MTDNTKIKWDNKKPLFFGEVFEDIKNKLEVDLLKNLSYEEINNIIHELNSKLDYLKSENVELEKQLKWHPIETAPKDGTHILVCGGTKEFTIHDPEPMEDAVKVSFKEGFEGNGWMAVDVCYYDVEVKNPTHWRPLPKTPKEDK